MKKNKKIEELAKRGEQHDVMDALILLTKAYIDMCGISLGSRTVVYCAAEPWLERLAWLDLPLSEMARKEPLVCVMPYITSDYDPEIYDNYDITAMNDEEYMECCKEIVQYNLFDEATNEVLCWGILKALEKDEFLAQEIEAMSPDGTHLKGFLTEQNCVHTSIDMQSPYNDASFVKFELVRDAKELLVEGYEDYNRLRHMEPKIRARYPKYQQELKKRENESMTKKYDTFKDVYRDIIGDTVLLCPNHLFHEWFGLEFYDLFAEIVKRESFKELK